MQSGPLPKVKSASLGKLALALLPLEKLKNVTPRGGSFEQDLHDFLVTNYNGYTVASGNISGHWTDDTGHDHYGEHREYKVAIPTQESLNCLEVFIAHMAFEMGEQCVYFEIGGEIRLLYAQPI
jgi:hypothetical protein